MTVKIQKEIREAGKCLDETDAGSVHREEVERTIAQHKQELISEQRWRRVAWRAAGGASQVTEGIKEVGGREIGLAEGS